jgi:hypothetical protein
MWLFTPIGFFSATVVEPKSPSYRDLPLPNDATRKDDPVVYVMVRARVYDDLNNLAFKVQELLGYEPEVYALKHHDYPYRIVIQRAHWAQVVGNLASGVDYPNFKSAVTRRQGMARHDLYMRVWSALYGAEEELDRIKARRKKQAERNRQGTLDWASPAPSHSLDPRSDSDMEAMYAGSPALYDLLAQTEDAAVVMDPPKPEPRRRRQKPRKKKGRKSAK